MTDNFALFFGALIVVFFSYDRFNRASYESDGRLDRLVTLVSPNKFRARRVVMQAWLSYATMLVGIYFILCAYAEVIPSIAGGSQLSESVGAQLKSDGDDGNIPAAVSLSVALAIVGLAPSFPILQRVDDSMLLTAHRLAGIPTRVLNDMDNLRLNAIELKMDPTSNPPNDLNIPSGYWKRLNYYAPFAKNNVSAPDDFIDDINLIFSVSAWILERRLKLHNAEVRGTFEALEDDLTKRFEFLKLELDERTGFALDSQRPPPQNEISARAGQEVDNDELKRRSWDRVASDVDALADDTCILLSLYVEHGVIDNKDPQTLPAGTSPAATDAQSDPAAHDASPTHLIAPDTPPRQKHTTLQQTLAQNLLIAFLQPILSHELRNQGPSNTVPVMLWSFSLIFLLTLGWTLTLGVYETSLSWNGAPQTFYVRAGRYFAVAINCFVIPIGVALAARNALSRSKRWANLSKSHWTVFIPQSGLVLLVSWCIAIFLVIAVTLWQVGLTETDGFSENQSIRALKGAFETNALAVARGALLGLLLVWLLDTHAARPLTAPASGQSVWTRSLSLKWALIGAGMMALIGFFARLVQSHVVLYYSPRSALDTIDYGLIFYATLYCSLIGFFLMFAMSEILASRWHLKADAIHRRRARPMRTSA